MDKLKFLKLSLIELVKQTIEKDTKLELFYSITFDKLTLYPFLLSTANGEKSRKVMFRHVFTDFEANEYGLVEIDIKTELYGLLTRKDDFFMPFFDTVHLDEQSNFDKIILFPSIDKIKSANIENLWNDSEIFINPYIKEVNYDLIKHLVKNILDKYPNFLLYSIEDLSFIIRNYYRSWKVQKVWNNNTDFDREDLNEATDYRYKIFTGEKHIVSS